MYSWNDRGAFETVQKKKKKGHSLPTTKHTKNRRKLEVCKSSRILAKKLHSSATVRRVRIYECAPFGRGLSHANAHCAKGFFLHVYGRKYGVIIYPCPTTLAILATPFTLALPQFFSLMPMVKFDHPLVRLREVFTFTDLEQTTQGNTSW